MAYVAQLLGYDLSVRQSAAFEYLNAPSNVYAIRISVPTLQQQFRTQVIQIQH